MRKRNQQGEAPTAIWMIRRKSDGFYSNLKNFYSKIVFGTKGNAFFSESKLISHLKILLRTREKVRARLWLHEDDGWQHPYKGCEIVKFTIKPDVSIDFEDYQQ